jgi:hypothetical protein
MQQIRLPDLLRAIALLSLMLSHINKGSLFFVFYVELFITLAVATPVMCSMLFFGVPKLRAIAFDKIVVFLILVLLDIYALFIVYCDNMIICSSNDNILLIPQHNDLVSKIYFQITTSRITTIIYTQYMYIFLFVAIIKCALFDVLMFRLVIDRWRGPRGGLKMAAVLPR